MPKTYECFCRVTTAFSPVDGGIDEHAFRLWLQRFVDAKIGVYLGSAGMGEGQTLTRAELKRVYEIGVDHCKGKVPVYANIPEQMTARDTIEQAKFAIDCGVEAINVYGAEGRHEYKATDYELTHYFDRVLSAVDFPVALAAQPGIGYRINPAIIAKMCDSHANVIAVNLTGVEDSYFLYLREKVSREMAYYVHITGSLNMLLLGARGVLGAEINVIPATYRRYLDLIAERNFEEAALVYADIKRYINYTARWNPAPTRWIKMAQRALKLPGGEGGIREPYMIPPAAEMQEFTEGLISLGVGEIDEAARKAGLKS
jgi:4-hydroxy-tetrahydrodipicolinate synthase